MRKIIGSLFQSLDGVIQAPGGPEEDQSGFAHGGWVFSYFDELLHEPMGRLLGGNYELLLGRRTYEIFAAYSPQRRPADRQDVQCRSKVYRDIVRPAADVEQQPAPRRPSGRGCRVSQGQQWTGPADPRQQHALRGAASTLDN